jgi:hypothetical protein
MPEGVPTATASQKLNSLPSFGAGDVLMFVLDPATARLWTGKNGIWHSDLVSGAPTWTAGGNTAFHPHIHGRNPGDGGTLRTLPSQFSYPVPPVARALGFAGPDLSIFEADAFIEFGWDKDLSVGEFDAWLAFGGGTRLTTATAVQFVDYGGGKALTTAHTSLYIEVELPLVPSCIWAISPPTSPVSRGCSEPQPEGSTPPLMSTPTAPERRAAQFSHVPRTRPSWRVFSCPVTGERSNIRTSDTRDPIRLIQSGLEQLGRSPGAIDGLWGPAYSPCNKSTVGRQWSRGLPGTAGPPALDH